MEADYREGGRCLVAQEAERFGIIDNQAACHPPAPLTSEGSGGSPPQIKNPNKRTDRTGLGTGSLLRDW